MSPLREKCPCNPPPNYCQHHALLEEVNQKNSLAAIDKFIEEKQKTTYIVIDPMFQGCDFQRKGWIK